jgi:hypothetical protein
MQKPEIFISYAWGGESEKIVDVLYNAFQAKGYNIIRDKVNLGFKAQLLHLWTELGKATM